ncbi:MAG: bifunctional phosphopantothenoylcysteine decarboxylase/phosphopantothenate--cysteine ligase CoaBC [Gammaproteobacteria bacterium]|nr:bifunctional phosphopantothenoylcysteine decarboxylase/phosphopantothenate--cysteine ligase CoaBC [Rhodocyclaceae bacterium]MBU3907625.1 bifunctional phosphopantothenoylcysteine decarboxylase/phosphopantothenate--cysteine ligase CoaBC [Gammaproteobacteria bacterium]MBU3990887.1 bifunctional phosphopantothenoylcysteine decarboxylase/phosphopantothenate--cysteine ligase CoaBC [Gammaproteobacteria bacterium]MBU4004271.1 bifunctional phosphopantothenoylcysteine decarboxylase/phosphopantothenate--
MSDELAGKHIVLGITGGVAGYKAAELARLLGKAGAQVDVVMTAAAIHFVAPLTFQALTGRPVFTSLWDVPQENGMAHIDLTRRADAVIVAPATADFIAKLVHGLADDLLASLCLARDCPLLVAPAMNRQMWEHPATVRNMAQLRADGVGVLGPASGAQACGEVGAGRMLEPAEIIDALRASFQPKMLAGKRVLLTAGPTFEALDPVRGLTNSSSGKMGFALAQASAEAGAEVTLVAGPVSLPTPAGVTRIDVTGALEMRDAVKSALAGRHIFIAVAAVADYRPAVPVAHKIKKGAQTLTLELVANPDILAEVAARPDAPFCVGFAAESQNLAEYAEGKRRAKQLPLVVGNLVQDGLGGNANVVTLFDAAGAHPLAPGDKLTIARAIVRHIAEMLDAQN